MNRPFPERYAASFQHLIHRFAVQASEVCVLPPLGKAHAAAGLIACSPNDMLNCFGGALGPLREGAPDGVGWGRMRCDEETLNPSLRGLLPPLRGPPPSRREAVKSRRFPNDMRRRFGGTPGRSSPTAKQEIASISVQRMICGGGSAAGWI